MKTPYCAALKLAGDALDQVRMAIARVQEELDGLDQRSASLRSAVIAERACAAGNPELSSSCAWFDRSATEHARLAVRRDACAAILEGLREEASARLASCKALEQAAEQFRAAERRLHARREQASADDRSATMFLRHSRVRVAAGLA